MSAEHSKPIFESGTPQPEQRQPDKIDLPRNPTHQKKLGERIFEFLSLEKQANKIPQKQHSSKDENLPKSPEQHRQEGVFSVVKQLDAISAMINSGNSANLTPEKFPDIDPVQVEEYRRDSLGNRRAKLAMKGDSSIFTAEKFPTVSEENLENVRFLADTAKAKTFLDKASLVKDDDLRAMLQGRANDVLKKRDTRYKEFLMERSPEPITLVQLVKDQPAKIIPHSRKHEDTTYL